MTSSAVCAALVLGLAVVPCQAAAAEREAGATTISRPDPAPRTARDRDTASPKADAAGPTLRWTQAPELVILMSVMQYQLDGTNSYTATAEQLTEEEAAGLAGDLTAALALMTGDLFTTFKTVRHEFVAAGAVADVLRPGQIVVGRFLGVREKAKTIGLGGRSVHRDGTIGSGAIVLDHDYDRSSSLRNLLRTHELGHALGYDHVHSRPSIMNERIGATPTELDRDAAIARFRGVATNTIASR